MRAGARADARGRWRGLQQHRGHRGRVRLAARSCPIDGLLLVTPAYNRPSQEGLFQHFAAAAQAAGKPLLLYNVPSRTAVDMKPATVARLSRIPGIVGIKEAVPDPSGWRSLWPPARQALWC